MSARIYHKPGCGASRSVLGPDLAGSLGSENGLSFLRGEQIAGDDPGFVATLLNAGLPVDDLVEIGRTFYAYRMRSGRLIGYGGFECYGRDVLLRSIVVSSTDRRQGIGRNLLTLLQRRAYDQGAHQAWLLTEAAAPFFEREFVAEMVLVEVNGKYLVDHVMVF